MKTIEINPRGDRFQLIIVDRNRASTPALTQEEINKLARECDKHRNDKSCCGYVQHGAYNTYIPE